MYVARLCSIKDVCVDYKCVLCCSVCLFDCVGMLVLRVMVYAFVLMCCKVALQITSV